VAAGQSFPTRDLMARGVGEVREVAATTKPPPTRSSSPPQGGRGTIRRSIPRSCDEAHHGYWRREADQTVSSMTQPDSLKKIGDSQSDDWNKIIADQIIGSLWLNNSDEHKHDRQISTVLAGLTGISPKDESEGMIAAQLIAAHNAAMECYRRAMLGEQTFEGRRENLSQANKLSRTFAVLLDALNRHRGKGQQTVRVEHVHVYAGGQAVVGMVEPPGGGDRLKPEDQPHAKQITHAPQPEVPRANPQQDLVPIASDAERPLPNARRKVAGSPKGNKNALKHGRYTADAIARRRDIAKLLRQARQLMGNST
jgi:hypothetical protein